MNEKCILQGDFNLDFSKMYDDNYGYKNLFDGFDDEMSMYNLVQMVDFVTWSRMVGSIVRSSILDHIYVKDHTLVRNLRSLKPLFGDHMHLMSEIDITKTDSLRIVGC